MLYQAGLGVDLRRLRESAGMSTRSVAMRIGTSHSSIARTEVGTRNATPDEVIAMCALYGVVGRQRERLIERARAGSSSRTWFATGPGATEQTATLVELEREASTITNVALTLVPGLVQTPEYVRKIIGLGRVPDHEYEWLVRTRIGRQALLSQPNAPSVRFFLDETALRRRIGGPALMRDQLDHLLRISRHPHLAVRVIPFLAGEHPAVDGGFVLHTFPEREPHVYIESRRGALFLSDPEQVQPYRQILVDLEDVALDVPGSLELIDAVKETMHDD